MEDMQVKRLRSHGPSYNDGAVVHHLRADQVARSTTLRYRPALALLPMGLAKPTAFGVCMVVGMQVHDRLIRARQTQ
jgi:hypothetical protein